MLSLLKTMDWVINPIKSTHWGNQEIEQMQELSRKIPLSSLVILFPVEIKDMLSILMETYINLQIPMMVLGIGLVVQVKISQNRNA